jgi:type IV pilus assembly protein PilB
LVRRVCPDCREEYLANRQEREILGIADQEPLRLVKGRGCPACNETGYRGRIGIFEILEIDRDLRAMINKQVSLDEISEEAIRLGMAPLWQDCREKVIQQITTLEEAIRVTQIY